MTTALEQLCPHCGAPRAAGPDCPRCGVIYARAHAPPPERPVPFPEPHPARAAAPEISSWDEDAADARLELRLRAAALPAALAIALLLVKSGFSHLLLRTFLSMWVHESGHALTAWLCGYVSFPGPWLTPTAATRSPLFSLLVTAALAALAVRGHKFGRPGLIACAATLFALQLAGTLALSVERARALIIFGGDAGCLVLGTALMATFYAPRDSALRRGWLRWGFVAIGAAAFADAFEQWWAARTDFERIPYGENEGVGLSDPSRLNEQFGWSTGQIVQRYVALGCACLAVLAVLYVAGLVQERRRARGG